MHRDRAAGPLHYPVGFCRLAMPGKSLFLSRKIHRWRGFRVWLPRKPLLPIPAGANPPDALQRPATLQYARIDQEHRWPEQGPHQWQRRSFHLENIASDPAKGRRSGLYLSVRILRSGDCAHRIRCMKDKVPRVCRTDFRCIAGRAM